MELLLSMQCDPTEKRKLKEFADRLVEETICEQVDCHNIDDGLCTQCPFYHIDDKLRGIANTIRTQIMK